MRFVANPILQRQILQNFDVFMKNQSQFLQSNNIAPSQMNDPRAIFEQMTGQKVPDEYANNPLGYLMSLNMPQQQMNPMVNMYNMLINRR